MSTETFMVAVVQDSTRMFDTPAALHNVENWCRQAASAGAAIALFPEAYIGGYPKGIDFGLRLGMRLPEGRGIFRRYFDGAIEMGGPEQQQLSEIAKKYGLQLVLGVVERVGSTLHCAAWFFDRYGKLQGVHRKLMPTALERCVWGMADGSTMPVLDTPQGRLGAAICWENYMPLYRTHLYSKGIELYCAPTVDDRDQWQATIRHIALEGRCFVMSACQFLTRADMPEDLAPIQGDDPETILIRGGSAIVSPLGEFLAGPVYGEKKMLTVEIDRARLAEARFDMDVVGHYARPDIFTLVADETPRMAQAADAIIDPSEPEES